MSKKEQEGWERRISSAERVNVEESWGFILQFMWRLKRSGPRKILAILLRMHGMKKKREALMTIICEQEDESQQSKCKGW